MLNDNRGMIRRENDSPEGSVYTANLRNALARTHYKMNGQKTTPYHENEELSKERQRMQVTAYSLPFLHTLLAQDHNAL